MARTKQTRTKQERIVEAVRHGLEGGAAVESIHQNGYAMTTAGVARHLRAMGGRGHVQELLESGLSNIEVLQACFPEDDTIEADQPAPSQGELFAEEPARRNTVPFGGPDSPLYATTRVTVRVPADLYEAIRLASRAEDKTQNQLIVDILTHALSRIPGPFET